jgi:hypothetical protein
MRFSLARPPVVGTVGTLLSTPAGPPVASAGVPQALAAGLPRAALSAVHLAAVATAADDHLAPAASA